MSLGPAPTGGWRFLVGALRRSATRLARLPRADEASGRLEERFARAIELRSSLLEGPSFAALAPAVAAAARATPGDAQAAAGRQSSARRRDDRGAWGAEDGATKGGRPSARAIFPAVPSGTRETRARAEAGFSAASAAPATASRREGTWPPSGAANDEDLAPVISLARAAGRARTLPRASVGSPGDRRSAAAGGAPSPADGTPGPSAMPSTRADEGDGPVGAALLAALVDELAPRRRGRRASGGSGARRRDEERAPGGSPSARPSPGAELATESRPSFGGDGPRPEAARRAGWKRPFDGGTAGKAGEPTPPTPGGLASDPIVDLPAGGSWPPRPHPERPDSEPSSASPVSLPPITPSAPPSPIVPLALDGGELADLVAESLAEHARLHGVELP